MAGGVDKPAKVPMQEEKAQHVSIDLCGQGPLASIVCIWEHFKRLGVRPLKFWREGFSWGLVTVAVKGEEQGSVLSREAW